MLHIRKWGQNFALPNPFTYSGRIEKPEDFVGCEAELRYIFDRLEPVVRMGQPQSISIVGERRIGKMSLLYHMTQVYRQRLSQPDAYLFAYPDLESAIFQTVPGLLGAILQALLPDRTHAPLGAATRAVYTCGKARNMMLKLATRHFFADCPFRFVAIWDQRDHITPILSAQAGFIVRGGR